MTHSVHYLNPSDAARKLGISTKALRLYETRGLIAPIRTQAGWRTYGPDAMARAAEIVALRTLGLSLKDVNSVLSGDLQTLERVLAAQEQSVTRQIGQLGETVARIKELRGGLAEGKVPDTAEVASLLQGRKHKKLSLELPWPWGGETFDLSDIRSLNYITGPLGSGKTQLARAIADAVPNGLFVGLERLSGDPRLSYAGLSGPQKAQVERTVQLLCSAGAEATDELTALVITIEANQGSILVIDLVEQGLDLASQEAVADYLRNQNDDRPPLFVMTRSTAILDLDAVGPKETIIYCPANHSPPMQVFAYPGAIGYEAVTTCLAAPEVRARTEGVVAMRPARSGERGTRKQ